MLLAVDIGNTHTVLGLYKGDQLQTHWRITSATTRTEDECWILVKMLCESSGLAIGEIRGAALSSVVPGLTPVFVKAFENRIGLSPVVVEAGLDLGIKILYDDPRAVGADRLCNAVGGFRKYGGPLIVVDFGTATTFDVISATGDYLGGVISPGIESSASVLHRLAAKLPRVELKFPDRIIGTNTEASMQSGILYGAVEAVEGLVQRIREELGNNADGVATGGLASLVVPRLRTVKKIDPFLTLDGLRLIHERVRGRS